MTENLPEHARTYRRFAVLTVLLGFAFGSWSAAGDEHWKRYPYQPDGTKIEFPRDEGTHKSDPSVKMEWWYVSFHLKAPSSGREYAVMVAFFKEIRGYSMRLFNITSHSEGKMHTATAVGRLKSAEGRLDITHASDHGSDRLYVKQDRNGAIMPFQYHLDTRGHDMSVSLDMESVKRPLIVGGNGYVRVGNSGHSWYYSFTRMKVNGTIQVRGEKMEVEGLGWMDHQWGPFIVSPIPVIQTDTYEWFSMQLDNGEEYMVSNIFDKKNRLLQLDGFGGLGWMLADSSSGKTVDFTLNRLAFWQAPSSEYYSAKWQVIEPGRGVDLVITPDIQNQIVPFPPTPIGQFYFWEGSCSVTGKVQGKAVNGKAFGELVHRYQVPVLAFKFPAEGSTLQGKAKIVWSVDNPDQGNPLKYKLFCCAGDGEPVLVAGELSSNDYVWDTAGFPNGNNYALKLVATSRDGTISGERLSHCFSIQN
jgi:predicted secreted hydrolase